ncbi:MAG TPA: alpha/beta fold hydrolase [Pirellulales bacterium]|nr:alpha/beta fold hydrolase [Pirellulales bacterium]
MIAAGFPDFRPHALFRGGHAQTLAGIYLPGPRYPYRAARHQVALADGDRIVLHDDRPSGWRPGERTAIMIHGLAGCHTSPYMRRIAGKLADRGVRVFRMDLRGCGAGVGLARLPYHSGQSEDAAAAVEAVARLCPGSPTTLIGFSLGGNITLKLVGELGDRPCGGLDSAVAVCPPVDLQAAVARMSRPQNRPYDRHFVRLLLRRVDQRRLALPDAPTVEFARRPRGLWEFDEAFTAPVSGFRSAENYYRRSSSCRVVPNICRPTLLIASRDDPLVPSVSLEALNLPAAVRLCLTESGGHLGFVGRPGLDPDRRWLDWRIVEWVTTPNSSEGRG